MHRWLSQVGSTWVFSRIFSPDSCSARRRAVTALPLCRTIGFLPLYVYESVTFQTMPVTAVSVASIAYVAVFPSLLSYMFWNHATQKLGVNRTGQFSHLMPVFGILLATLLLGERLQFYHALGMLLVAAGLVLTNKFKEGKP